MVAAIPRSERLLIIRVNHAILNPIRRVRITDGVVSPVAFDCRKTYAIGTTSIDKQKIRLSVEVIVYVAFVAVLNQFKMQMWTCGIARGADVTD